MVVATPLNLADRFDQTVFNTICSWGLVYNSCREDPAVDRPALNIGRDDNLLVMNRAGCNVLDDAWPDPSCIYAVDANPTQNALLELKLAGIRRLEFDDFFRAFGHGYHAGFGDIYRTELRAELTPFARAFWDRRAGWFGSISDSSRYHGLSGIVSRLFRAYLTVRPRLADGIRELCATRKLDEQRRVSDNAVRPLMWTRAMNWTLSRQITMSLLGVRHPQRKSMSVQHNRAVACLVRESLEYLMRQLAVSTNDFRSVYLRGRRTEDGCPEYLKQDNFQESKNGLAERTQLRMATVTGFLQAADRPMLKCKLLDRMRWTSSFCPGPLAEQWRYILRRATPGAPIVVRSAHAAPTYFDGLELGDGRERLQDKLRCHRDPAADLQRLDRVHTYAAFRVADVRP